MLAGLLILIAIALAVLFMYRQRLLKYAVETVQDKVEAKYPAKLHIGKAAFEDLNTVRMENIALVPNQGDTLLRTQEVFAEISLRTLFKGRVIFNQLSIENAYLTAVKNPDGTNNYSFLLGKKTAEPVDTTQSRNYGKLLNDLIEKAFESVPDKLSFKNLHVCYASEHRNITMKIPSLQIDNG